MKKVLLIVVFVASSSIYAEYENPYEEYELQYGGSQETNLVFEGVEWMRWDVTSGMSMLEALDAYRDDGWRLASNYEMSSLVNYAMWNVADHNGALIGPTYYESGEDFSGRTEDLSASWLIPSRILSWFGALDTPCRGAIELSVSPYECEMTSHVLYGSDEDGDGLYKSAYFSYYLWMEGEGLSSEIVGITSDLFSDSYVAPERPDSLGSPYYFLSSNYYNYGVALVRNEGYARVPEINANGAVMAFSLLFSLLMFVREKKMYSGNV